MNVRTYDQKIQRRLVGGKCMSRHSISNSTITRVILYSTGNRTAQVNDLEIGPKGNVTCSLLA